MKKFKFEIEYYELPYGAGIFAVPKYFSSEFVDADSKKEVENYLLTKKDLSGGEYKKADKSNKKIFGFDYTSHAGAANIKKLTFKTL